jgi:poly(A) polymerase Pap1
VPLARTHSATDKQLSDRLQRVLHYKDCAAYISADRVFSALNSPSFARSPQKCILNEMADSKSSAQVGLTPAGFPVIDSTPPTELEIQQEIAFNDWFRMEVEKDHSSEVRIAEDAQRNRVLEFVQDSVQTTVKSLFKAQFPDDPLPPLHELAVILPYGSFRIDVHDAHSDMDIVAVVPEWVRREALFEGFRSCLSSCADCSCVQVLLSARAPVLKFVMFSFSVDVAVAILIYDRVPNPFSPQALIENVVDEKSALALVGPSNSDALLELVPDPERFRQLLRFIKLWAKNNFIYSNAFGFLGGMAWSLLCAFICQIYPRATVPALVARFFKVMKGWNWMATEVCVSPPQPISKWGGWSRHNGRDRALVHIITPVAPLQNSAFNVSQSALGIMTKRMWDAGKCFPFESFAGDNGSRQMLGCFSRALAKQNFFATYQRFIIFEVCSPSQDDHIGWRGLVESQLRKLISLVQDTVEQVQFLHPYPCAIDPPENESLMPNCFPPVPTASTPTDTAIASSPSASTPGSSDESVKLLSSKARFRTWFAIGIRC